MLQSTSGEGGILFSRRHILGSVLAAGATAVLPGAAHAFAIPPDERLLARARQELERLSSTIPRHDRVGIVDYSLPSWEQRFFLIDIEQGEVTGFRTTHGRGSDQDHVGWVQSFSNIPGSNASSRGAYLTAEQYEGIHGASMRLDGLDDDNSNARDRAIVVHGAWYANPDMIDKYGKLGRSEGCFAFAEAELPQILQRLGPGRLLYAGKI